MKKNTFIEGAFISTFSILICKIIGLLYVIPFYSLIGNKGGALYSYAYSIYAIFLSLSTCGIPLAISKNISEYNELGYHKAKNDVYKIGKYVILGLGLLSCLILLIFAPNIAYLIIGNVEGGNTIEDVSTAIRIVSLSLLIVPSLSVTRGYLNGHKMILPTSISEVLEQVVRVLVIVVGSFLTIKVFNLPTNVAVYIAVAGAGIGALVALIYLKLKLKRNKDAIVNESENEPEYRKKDIFKKIVLYALPFVVIDLIRSAYGMVDSFTVVKTMVNLGYDVSVAETTIGVLSTWATKLNMIVASVALGFVTSLIPNIAGSAAKKDLKDVNNKINESYKTLLFVVLPMTIGLSFLAQPVWVAFYGYNSLSIGIFKYYILQAIIFCVYTIALNLAQSMNQSKISLGSLLVSFLLKVVLNIPMMKLFVMMGIEAYYAPIITNILVQGSITLFIMLALKHKFKFDYKDTTKAILKMLLTLTIMVLILSGLSLIIPLTVTSRLKAILTIIPYILVGAAIYIGMSYKIGLLNDIFGAKKIKTIINKVKSKITKK
jgi:O-antigen/teichoic acid export membrane protein